MTDKNTVSSSIRTFAQDLADSKKKHAVTTPTSAKTSVPANTTHKATDSTPLPPIPKKQAVATSPKTPTKPASSSTKTTPQVPKKTAELPPIPPAKPSSKPPIPKAKPKAVHKIDTSELEKSLPKNTTSVLGSSSSKLADIDSDVSGGTVITDTKRKRLTLFGAISALVSSTWESIKSEYAQSKEPKYTVASAERRKGVIQTATTKTGRDSISDHQRVVNRIRALQASTSTDSIDIETDPEHLLTAPDNTPKWSTTTDSNRPADNPAHTSRNTRPETATNVSTDRPTAPAVIPVVSPSVTPPPTPDQPAVVPTTDERWSRAASAATPSSPPKDTPVNTTPPVIQPTTPPITPKVPVTQPAANPPTRTIEPTITPPAPKVETRLDDELFPRERSPETSTPPWTDKLPVSLTRTNILIAAGAGGVAVVAVALLIMQPQNYFWNTQTPTVATDTTANINPLPGNPNQTLFLSELLNQALVRNENAAPNELVTFSLSNDLSTAPIHTALLTELNNQLPQNFVDTITGLQVGVYQAQPFLILNSQDTTMALGGMYRWETTLPNDTRNLFGLVATTTTMTDKMIRSTDARIFHSPSKETVLVYGVVNNNHILITTTEPVFEYLIDTIITTN